jgi:hypothetical protein
MSKLRHLPLNVIQRLQIIPGYDKLAAGSLLVLFLLISFLSVRRLTLTYDEVDHYRYGFQILSLNSNRFDDSKMPFSALNALPAKVAMSWLGWDPVEVKDMIAVGRGVTVIVSALFAIVAFKWSKALYGLAAAFLTLILYIWDPNIIAHSQLVTTDIYSAGMILFSTYMFWFFNRSRTWKRAGLLGIVLGLSQLAKYTAVFLFPLFLVMQLVRDMPELAGFVSSRSFSSLFSYLRRMFGYAILVVVISIVIINIGFLFNRTMTPFGEYEFKSGRIQTIQAGFPGLGKIPVPVPYPFLEGLDYVRYRERTGKEFGRIYLLGELSEAGGFPGYYLYAYLYKAPIATQLLFLLAMGGYIFRRDFKSFLDNEFFLLGPILFFTIYFNFFYRAQIGFRYFLVVLPFMFIFSGSLLSGWKGFSTRKRLVFAGIVAYLVISTLSYFPHYIPYFNELVLDRRQAYKILADSNIDWGQSGWYVRRYLAQHPEALIDPKEPVSGTLLVSVNNLVGITAKPDTYRWLRENFQPVDTVAYAYLVYNISPLDLENFR